MLTCPDHFFEYQNVTDWEHLQVFSPEHMDVFFVYSPCTKKNQYSPMNKKRIQNTWCVRCSDAWNVHQVFRKYRHVLYYVFPVITALHRRILMLFFAHTEHTKNTSMCSGENTGRVKIVNMIIGNQWCPLLSWIFFHMFFFFNVFSVIWNINVTLQTAGFISVGYCKSCITPFFFMIHDVIQWTFLLLLRFHF